MRERLDSRLGFLMLAAGCAVGLGNVWRFPYVVGQNGGAAFVLVYLLFLALLGFPLLVAELSVGRAAQGGIASAFAALAPSRMSRKAWGAIGAVVFAGNFLLMFYYTDVAGWLMRYTVGYAIPSVMPVSPQGPAAAFEAMCGERLPCAAFACAAAGLAVAACACGVVKGVERATKAMMMALLALLVVLAARAVTLPGGMEGIRFYLAPDWARFMRHPVKAVFDAMGQAFFTLSLGVGCMTIFGSYLEKSRSLVSESLVIIAIDTFVAFLSGLVVFPACAAYGVDVAAGPGLIFVALPKVFAQMAGGRVWGFAFFLFLSFAALTTVIAVFECLVGGLVDAFRRPRAWTAVAVGVVVSVLSLPCVLVDSALGWEDFVFSQFWLPLGALATCVFVTWRFGWGWSGFSAEASAGRGLAMPRFMRGFMKWCLPLLILVVIAVGVSA